MEIDRKTACRVSPRPALQFSNDSGKPFAFADAVVPGSLHPVEPVPALIVLRQLMEIYARFPVDQLVGEDGCEVFSVIFLILYVFLQWIHLSYTISSLKRL